MDCVRCKDCKFWERKRRWNDKFGDCSYAEDISELGPKKYTGNKMLLSADGESYFSVVLTREDFGCVAGERRTEH